MERNPFIVVERFPYEEPHHTQLRIAASNGRYRGEVEIYCNIDMLQEIGSALTKFPGKVPDEYIFEYGSEDPKDRWAYYLRLRAYTVGGRGESALQVMMNLNGTTPDDGRCSFSIPDIEPAGLARLGRLFIQLEPHSRGSFSWALTEDEFRPNSSDGAA